MKLKNNESILFIGDSITDCQRDYPVGMGLGLGEGYVALVNTLLASLHPENNIKVLNTGIGGNRVVELEARWQSDVLDLSPDWLSVMIGINDVWGHFAPKPTSNKNFLRNFQKKYGRVPVTIEQFESIYRALLRQTPTNLKGLILMSPYFIESDPSDPMRQFMDAYSTVVKKLADEFDALFVDTQAAFDRYLAHRPSHSLSSDRVHPNQTGHMIIANAFMEAIR